MSTTNTSERISAAQQVHQHFARIGRLLKQDHPAIYEVIDAKLNGQESPDDLRAVLYEAMQLPYTLDELGSKAPIQVARDALGRLQEAYADRREQLNRAFKVRINDPLSETNVMKVFHAVFGDVVRLKKKRVRQGGTAAVMQYHTSGR